MKKCFSFILGGSGARGALHALFEVDFKPDLLVRTSIGAVTQQFWRFRVLT